MQIMTAGFRKGGVPWYFCCWFALAQFYARQSLARRDEFEYSGTADPTRSPSSLPSKDPTKTPLLLPLPPFTENPAGAPAPPTSVPLTLLTKPPLMSEPGVNPTKEPSERPSEKKSPSNGPTARSRLVQVVESPTRTPAPTMLVASKEISPEPSVSPRDEPTKRPSLALVVESPSSSPSSSPSLIQSDCVAAMKVADADGNKSLSKAEYTVFLQILADCPKPITLNAQMDAAFITSICLCTRFTTPFCCFYKAEVDISPAYVPTDQQTLQQRGLVASICDSADVVLPVDGECPTVPPTVPVPTPAPVPAPVSIPAPVSLPTEQPSLLPTLPPVTKTEITPSREPSLSPSTLLPLECVAAMKVADADDNKSLSKAEYTVFLQILANCPKPITLNAQMDAAFTTSICLCTSFATPFCCAYKLEVDISPAYVPTDQQNLNQRTLANLICYVAIAVLPPEGECPTVPPTVPVPAPVKLPTTTKPATTNPTTATTKPTTATTKPSTATTKPTTTKPTTTNPATTKPTTTEPTTSTTEPTTSTTEPTPSTTKPTTSTTKPATTRPATTEPTTTEPTVAPSPKLIPPASIPSSSIVQPLTESPSELSATCTSNMMSADGNIDFMLSQEEYLEFVKSQSNCDLVTSLSTVQAATFSTLACKCLDVINPNPNCCLPRNARVSIEGAGIPDASRSAAQRNALLEVCTKTDAVIPAVCAPPPTTVAPVVSPLFTPVSTSAPTPISAPAPIPAFAPTNVSTPPLTTNEPLSTLTPEYPAALPTTVSQMGPSLVPTRYAVTEPVGGPTPDPVGSAVEVPTQSPPTASPVAAPPKDPNFPYVPTSAPVTLVPMPSPPATESPIFPIVPSAPVPVECSLAMRDSDENSDGYMSQQEYLKFIQLYDGCNSTTILSSEQRSVFQRLAYACVNDPSEDPTCWLPGFARVNIGGAQYMARDPNFLVDVCSSTKSTFDDDCVASPTAAPVLAEDLDRCSQNLLSADLDKNGLLDKVEYLNFTQIYVQGELFTSLDLGHQATFQKLACDCLNSINATIECCMPDNARLNISGADLPGNRTTAQNETLSRICITADGLSKRKSAAPPIAIPQPADCADALVSSDTNSDNLIDMQEYISFIRLRHDECSEIQSLSFSQRLMFNILACSCLFKPGAQPDCCFPANATMNITGARLSVRDRTMEQVQFLSTICRASNSTVELGCRTFSPPFAPSAAQLFSGELPFAPTFTESSAEDLAVTSGSRRGRQLLPISCLKLVALMCSSIVTLVFL